MASAFLQSNKRFWYNKSMSIHQGTAAFTKHRLFTANAGTLATNPFILGEGQRAQMLRGSGMVSGVDDSYIGAEGPDDHLTPEQREQERNKRLLRQIATTSFLDEMLDKINKELGVVRTEISAIEKRQSEIALRRNELQGNVADLERQREEQINLRRDQAERVTDAESALSDAEKEHRAAVLNQDRVRMEIMRARDPERIRILTERAEAAGIQVRETKEVVAQRMQDLVSQKSTLEGMDTFIAKLDKGLAKTKEEIASLDAEDEANKEKLTILREREQTLLESKRILEDPELRAKVERGEMTCDDVIKTLPETMQERIMSKIENIATYASDVIWEKALSFGNSAANTASTIASGTTSVVNAVTSGATSVINTIGSYFSSDTPTGDRTGTTAARADGQSDRDVPHHT